MNVSSGNENNSYFEVHINKDKTYYIQPLINGQQSVDYLSTLQNIERIVTENLTYSPHIIDEYSKLKESDRLIMLKEDSNLIKKNYAETVKNSNWLYNMAFNQESYVNSATEKINTAVTEKLKILGLL